MSMFKVTEDIIRKVIIESTGIIKEDTSFWWYQDEITQLRIVSYELLGSEILVKCFYGVGEEEYADRLANLRINLLDYISFIYSDLKEQIMNKEYPEVLYCDGCEKKTRHRIKLGAIQNGCLVCNECNEMNEINQNQETATGEPSDDDNGEEKYDVE